MNDNNHTANRLYLILTTITLLICIPTMILIPGCEGGNSTNREEEGGPYYIGQSDDRGFVPAPEDPADTQLILQLAADRTALQDQLAELNSELPAVQRENESLKSQLERQKESHERLLIKMGDQLRQAESEIEELRGESRSKIGNPEKAIASVGEGGESAGDLYDGEYSQAIYGQLAESNPRLDPYFVKVEYSEDWKHITLTYPNGETQRVRVPAGVRRWKADLKEIFPDSP